MPNSLQVDPTRTTTLRRRMLAEVRRRFRRLREAVVKLVVENDAFGLKPKADPFTLNTRWQFEDDPTKLREFQAWFKDQVDRGLLGVDKGSDPTTPWTTEFIDSAYKQGLVRSYIETRKEDPSAPVFQAGQEQFLRDSFGVGVSRKRVEALATRAFDQLKGVTGPMSSAMSRVLADGLAAGINPRDIARQMVKEIDGIGLRRAETIARTEIIHAYAEGQLDGFERLGVEEVGVLAEWSTAGDNRVCSQCATLQGVVLTIEEARGIIPRHPNCRCAWVPALKDRREKGQITSRNRVEQAILKSIGVERPNAKNARQARKESRWAGADKKIAARKWAERVRKASPVKTPAAVAKPAASPTPPKVPLPAAPKNGMTFTGTPTDFGRAVWEKIGEGIRDEAHAREVGKLIYDAVWNDPRLKEPLDKWRAEFDAETKRREDKITKMEKDLAKLTDPGPRAYLEDDIRRQRAFLKTHLDARDAQERRVRGNLQPIASQVLDEKMREIRDMGPGSHKIGFRAATPTELPFDQRPQAGTKIDRDVLEKSFRDAQEKIPRDFVARMEEDTSRPSNRYVVDQTERGYFSSGKRHIMTSGGDSKRTFVHELTHYVEHVVVPTTPSGIRDLRRSNLGDLQREFIERRTKGEAKTTIYAGTNEVGWKDKFVEHYIGKDYGGRHWEVLTMGWDSLTADKYNDFRGDVWKDEDHASFVLGVMGGFF